MKTAKNVIENVYRKIEQQETKTRARKAAATKIAASACSVFLVATLVLGMFANQTDAESYKVLLDVNPSIEIQVDGNDKITEVTDLNRDGSQIIRDKRLAGKEVADGVGDLIGELVDQGYISQEANSVLVSIEGAEKEKAEQVRIELTERIESQLSKQEVEGSVIVQEIPKNDTALQENSAEYGISPGKAQLIAQILTQNSLHSYDELAAMSIHELNIIRESYYVNPEGVQVSGAPSHMTYIGEQQATQIATDDAQDTYTDMQVELTCRAGAMVYRVEFENDTFEYRYQVNAVTGEILSAEKIEPGKENFFQGDTPVATVGENAALNAALTHAGIENTTLIRCKYKTDWVDGTVIYDMYFTDGHTSCTYVVNARTGEILKYGKTQEYHDRSVSAAVIGEAKAKTIALAKDGLIDGNISKYETVLKKVDDAYVYDMMFLCNGIKYTAQIAAADGTVLTFDKVDLHDIGKPSVEDGNQTSAEG